MSATCSPLESARLEMEPTRPDHADETFSYLEDEAMWRYFAHQRPASLESLRETYANRARGPSRGNSRWENWILRERISGAAVGDLQATVFPDEHRALIAYGVFPPFRGRGYAREAVRALLEHLRNAHHVAVASAEISPQNEPSLRLVRDFGFTQTGEDAGDLIFERRLA